MLSSTRSLRKSSIKKLLEDLSETQKKLELVVLRIHCEQDFVKSLLADLYTWPCSIKRNQEDLEANKIFRSRLESRVKYIEKLIKHKRKHYNWPRS